MANTGTHRLSMANTKDNNTIRRENNTQNEIKYMNNKLTTCLK